MTVIVSLATHHTQIAWMTATWTTTRYAAKTAAARPTTAPTAAAVSLALAAVASRTAYDARPRYATGIPASFE